MRALVKNGLAMSLVDDVEFRAAVTMSARCGLTYVDAQKAETKMPHRTVMMLKVLPALDAKLNGKVSKKIDGLIKETSAVIISDGWTSCQRRPIINAIVSTAAGSQLVKSVDTSGETKDAAFIADFIGEVIVSKGSHNIVAVCMDGACKASFALITAKFPHVFSYICPAHSLDNFMKNVCSESAKIQVKSIEGLFDWDTDIFSSPIYDAQKVIKFITHHSKALHLFRPIASNPKIWSDAEMAKPVFIDLMKHCETRFASNMRMLQRYQALKIVVEALVADAAYKVMPSRVVSSRLV